MDALFAKWEPIINAHKLSPMTEIEMRLGRRASSGFDTNIGKDTFMKVLRALQKYKEWEDSKHTNTTIYYFQNNKRLSVNEETDEQVGQIKKRVTVDDIELVSEPFDIRLGISTEIPFDYDGEETSTQQKTKERWSFVRKNLSIDMSIVKGNPDDKDVDDDTTYQIELEIINPSHVKTRDELFNILHKIFDLLKCV